MTTWVLGTDQERALRQAVQRTAADLDPEDAGQLAMVIGQVFAVPAAAELLAGSGTPLERLGAEVAWRLASLDDAALTSTGRSSADVLGVPAGELAGKLTGYLVREIVVWGARGGPLEPLAAQLNHDVTHLQGQAA